MEDIKTIFLDVDGTLTNSKVYLDNHQNEFKAFNVKDGLMITAAMKLGYEFIIITGRKSEVVARRAAELGIEEYHQGISNKRELLEAILEEKEINYENMAYFGDDLNDLAIMKEAGFAASPLDAAEEVKEISDFISKFLGGNGAVREILSYLLKENGEYQTVVENFN